MTTETSGPVQQTENSAPSSANIVRRSLLLRGLGKSSVALAAGLPIITLASPSTFDGKMCTVSGVQSAVNSQSTTTTTCGGFSQTYYRTLANWPGYNATSQSASFMVGGQARTQTSRFSDIFGTGNNTQLLAVINNTSNSNVSRNANGIWVTALLNAAKNPNGNFPYTADKVVAFFKETNLTKRDQALRFFNDYMQRMG